MAERQDLHRADDLIQPFQVESMAAQGRLVRLGAVAQSVLGAHHYPEPVARMLGECLALAAVLAGGFRYDGVLTLQLKGDGPVSVLVVDVTSAGAMRGYAQFEAGRVREAAGGAQSSAGALRALLGAGYLAYTIDEGPESQRYQGLVALEGATLAACAEAYLRRSVQLEAAVMLAAGRVGNGRGEAGWRAGGLIVQHTASRDGTEALGDEAESADAWRRAAAMARSSTGDELLDPGLHPHRLLYRLFREDGVRVFRPAALAMGCRCSRERVARVLRAFPRAEIEAMKVDARVVVTCEFCNASYSFDEAMLEALYAP